MNAPRQAGIALLAVIVAIGIAAAVLVVRGLDAGAPEILGALQPARQIEALMPAKGRIARFPLWQAAAQDST
jgi:hypothetical protein